MRPLHLPGGAKTGNEEPVHFDVWGCRGSRNFLPARSRVGNNTSCYSLLRGDHLFVFDAGRGLCALGDAMETSSRFAGVRYVEAFVSHAHCDHWEGLKDVGWFWRRGNGLEVTIHATTEALDAIEGGFAHPSYVPLDILAQGTVAGFRRSPTQPRDRRTGPGWVLDTFPLNHASGRGPTRRPLDTLGYRVRLDEGPTVAYLLDHEPVPETLEMELEILAGTQLAVYDSHFATVAEQTFGHGSLEHAGNMARRHPGLTVLAGHHGPMYSDAQLKENLRRFGRNAPGLRLAVEGQGYLWNARTGRFARRTLARRAAGRVLGAPVAAEPPLR
jgi:phosphoribosyl 1,2-cyclic phosphodiesterase